MGRAVSEIVFAPTIEDPHRYFAGSDGHIYSWCLYSFRRLAGTLSKGYLKVKVVLPGCVVIDVRVHRAVCAAFHGPCPEGLQASHLNGICTDNQPGNLQWESAADNHHRRHEHGTALQGEDNGRSVLTADNVREIRSLGLGASEAARKYGVGRTTVGHVLAGRTWLHV